MNEHNNTSQEVFEDQFPIPQDVCLEIVPFHKHFNNFDCSGPPLVTMYFKQEKLSLDDMVEILNMDSISLVDACHMLLGIKTNVYSSLVLTRPIVFFYEKAIKDIKKNKLKVEHLNKDGLWVKRKLQNLRIHSNDGTCVVELYGSPHGEVYFFKPYIFIDWALSKGLFINHDLLKLIRVFPVAKSRNYLKKTSLFDFVLADPTIPTKQQLEDLGLLATAQVIWEEVNPNIPISKMEEHKLVKRWIPNGCYSNRHIFRNKIKTIDPRPRVIRVRNSQKRLINTPYPPKIIPGVVETNDEGQKTMNYPNLKQVLRVLVHTLLVIHPEFTSENLFSHRLILLYIKDTHPFLHTLVNEWINEFKQKLK
jgi:hypothetical protein